MRRPSKCLPKLSGNPVAAAIKNRNVSSKKISCLSELENDTDRKLLENVENEATVEYKPDFRNFPEAPHGGIKQRVYTAQREFLGDYKTVLAKEGICEKSLRRLWRRSGTGAFFPNLRLWELHEGSIKFFGWGNRRYHPTRGQDIGRFRPRRGLSTHSSRNAARQAQSFGRRAHPESPQQPGRIKIRRAVFPPKGTNAAAGTRIGRDHGA